MEQSKMVRITQIWDHDLEVNATFARLDSGEKLLAVISDEEF